jgi:CelD/BcsL family acetyltransferase involved in cellulose biosynthesis
MTIQGLPLRAASAWPLITARHQGFIATATPGAAILADSFRSPDVRAATPYQTACWLQAWYAGFDASADVEPLIVSIRTASCDRLAMLLPLVVARSAGLRTIEFADLGITDCNAPILGPAAPSDREGAAALWEVVRRALPAADLMRLTKMPATVSGRPNPLALLPGAGPSPVHSNVVEIGDDFGEWQRMALRSDTRNDLRRAARMFARHPGAAFLRVRYGTAARRIYEDLRAMQRRRAVEAGFDYRLDQPAYDEVYRRTLENGLESGEAILTALVVGEETVAASFAIADGRSCAMLRIGDAGGEWRKSMSGRLLMHRTLEHLHGEGYRTFDFSLGNQDYKRRLGARQKPLLEVTRALSLRGVPQATLAWARTSVRARPRLAALGRRLLTARTTAGASP